MKRATQVDVARRAGVSRATVSYVLNGINSDRVPISSTTQQRVWKAIAELGYEPDARARALRSGNTNTIAFIIPDMLNPHFSEYAAGIEQEARLAGYHVLTSSTSQNDEYAVEMFKDLARYRIDGMILGSSFILASTEAHIILEQLLKQNLPMVELNDQYGVDSVSSDYRRATAEVMDHLFSLGHHRIGLINGVGGQELAEDRLKPYLSALRAATIPIDKSLIAHCGPTLDDGYQAAMELLKLKERPTAIIAINDLLAIGVLRAAADHSLGIPTDLSVVGFDDISMSKYLSPRLTTVSKDTINLGRKAFSMLLARIQNPDLPRQKHYQTAQLIIRESTGTAPQLK
jgi:LacI family transcriptional regulator